MYDQDTHIKTADHLENRFERRLEQELSKLRVEVHAMRAGIIRWMFLFWIGQAATVFAMVKLLK